MLQRQFAINTIATIFNIAIQFAVSFFLTSYLVMTVGSTAYGFVVLANTIVSYTLIVSTALNSMSARFIGVEYYNKNIVEATRYYSSVLFGDILFVLFLIGPAVVGIWNIDYFVDVPTDIISDVKQLFYIIFVNMCVNVGTAVFSGVFVIRNRLDLSSVISILSNLLKAGLLIAFYACFETSIVYIGVATLIASVFVAVVNMYYNRRLVPDIKPNIRTVSLRAIKTIISAGVWNSFNHLSWVLLHGFDLLMCNIMIGVVAMGSLSIAGTLPSVVSTCVSTLSNLFTPKYLEHFSTNNYKALFAEVNNSIRFMTVISCAPISFLIGFGLPFYQLWTPSADVETIYLLSIFIIVPNFTGAGINSVNYLYTVVNRVKMPSIVLFVTGVANIAIVYLLLQFTDLGVYAIVVVSALIGLFRNILFNAPYAALCIKQKFYAFYKPMLYSSVILTVTCVLAWVISNTCQPSSWLELIGMGGITCIGMMTVVAYIVLDSKQRKDLLSRIHLKRV